MGIACISRCLRGLTGDVTRRPPQREGVGSRDEHVLIQVCARRAIFGRQGTSLPHGPRVFQGASCQDSGRLGALTCAMDHARFGEVTLGTWWFTLARKASGK